MEPVLEIIIAPALILFFVGAALIFGPCLFVLVMSAWIFVLFMVFVAVVIILAPMILLAIIFVWILLLCSREPRGRSKESANMKCAPCVFISEG